MSKEAILKPTCCGVEVQMIEVSDNIFSIGINHEDDCPVWLGIQQDDKLMAANQAMTDYVAELYEKE